MTALNDLTITAAKAGLDKKEFSAVDLTQACLGAMEKHRDLNAFILETPERALEDAKASDDRRAKGEANGALDGIPLAIKDLFCTKGIQTTASSRILKGFTPEYESTVTTKLWNAGAVCLGKVSCDEFAMGSSNTTSAYGNVISPWKRKNDPSAQLVPGGSSGGSSSAVAARMALGATGTDTGGSIRQPAAITGICGIKPTYGRVSRWGVVAFASSLDQAGVFARSVEDCALFLETIAGHDPKDSTSANVAVPNWSAMVDAGVAGMRIGIPKEYRIDGLRAEVAASWDAGIAWLKDAGATIVDISLPHTQYALPAYYILAPAEASSNLARYDGVRYGHRASEPKDLLDLYERTRAEGFGTEVKSRILVGTYVLSAGYYDAYYIKAQRLRRLIYNDFVEAFKSCDAILAPATPSAAFAIGEKTSDPVEMYLEDVFTVSANIAGIPGMAVPAAITDEGLPLGLQILGKHWDEASVFKVARALERAANFTAKPEGV